MANFGGHAIPGSFFLLFGFWLTVKNILQHHWRTKQPKGRPITPPLFKKMNYFEGGFATFASFVGVCPSRLLCTLEPLCNLRSSHHGWSPVLSPFRYYGRAVCAGRTTCTSLQQREQRMGQADELAAQHHVSVLRHLWNRAGCQHCNQTGACWLQPPCALHRSFCRR